MSEPRTFTVDTRDRGLITVTDPPWCDVDHDELDAPADRRTLRQALRHAWYVATGRRPRRIDHRPYASEISHVSEPVEITVNGPDGEHLLLALMLWQNPLPTPTFEYGAEVYVVAQVGTAYLDFTFEALDSLSVDLLEAAGRVRLAARDLAATANGGAR